MHRSEPEGRFLYLLKDSVTAQSLLEGERGGRDKPPVPPCILPIDNNTTQISLEIYDRGPPAPFYTTRPPSPYANLCTLSPNGLIRECVNLNTFAVSLHPLSA